MIKKINKLFSLFMATLMLLSLNANLAFAGTPSVKKPQTVRVLSLDGGGIKSIITLKILDYLEKNTGKRTTEMFDLIAGTSSGGLIALYFSIPDEKDPHKSKYSAEEVLDLVQKDAKVIFRRRLATRVLGQNIVQIAKPAYPQRNIIKATESRFHDMRLYDSKIKSLIISFDTQNTEPFCFRSYDDKVNFAFMKDVAIATSVAPFYFSPIQFQDGNNKERSLVDGGLVAKNPSVFAYTEAKLLYPNDNIFLLSLGAGYQQKERYRYDKMKGWGFAKFILPTIVFMLDGTSNANDEYMQKLTAQNKNDIYIRLQPVYNKVFDKFNNKPDDVTEDNLENLNKIADEYIQENKKELDNLVRILLESENASL